MQKLFKFSINEFLYNGHLQSVGGAGIVFIAGFLINGFPPSIWILILIYLTFQMVFIYDRFKGFEIDKKGNSERSKHLASYYSKIPYILLVMLLVWSVLLISLENLYSSLMLIAILSLGFLYPIYFKNLTKRIFMFKNFYVAGVYGIICFYPLLHYQSPNFGRVVLFCLIILTENIYSQIILDIKDIDDDRTQKLKTFPAIYGFNKSVNFALLASIFSEILFLFIIIIFDRQPLFYLLIFINLIVNIVVYKLLTNKHKPTKTPFFLSAAKCLILFCASVPFVLILK